MWDHLEHSALNRHIRSGIILAVRETLICHTGERGVGGEYQSLLHCLPVVVTRNTGTQLTVGMLIGGVYAILESNVMKESQTYTDQVLD